MFALFLVRIRLFLSMLSDLLALSVSSLCFSLPLRLLRLSRLLSQPLLLLLLGSQLCTESLKLGVDVVN